MKNAYIEIMNELLIFAHVYKYIHIYGLLMHIGVYNVLIDIVFWCILFNKQ